MSEFVRVRLANGSHKSMPTASAQSAGLRPLKQPALNRDGSLARTKHRVNLDGSRVSAAPTEAVDASEKEGED